MTNKNGLTDREAWWPETGKRRELAPPFECLADLFAVLINGVPFSEYDKAVCNEALRSGRQKIRKNKTRR